VSGTREIEIGCVKNTLGNDDPKPFVWTADPDKIIAAVRRGYQTLDLIH